MWAGRNTAWGQVSKVSASRSWEESPKMGRPSAWRLPIRSSRRASFSAASRLGEKEDVVHLSGLAPLLVDGADFPRDEKPRLPLGPGAVPGQAVRLLQAVEPLLRREELLLQLLPPGGVSEVPGAHQSDALFPGPQVQVGQVAVPAGGPGVAGVDVQVA